MTLSSDIHYGKTYGKCVDFLNDPFPTTGKDKINILIHKYRTVDYFTRRQETLPVCVLNSPKPVF